MAEPENQTLRLLREIRTAVAETRERFDAVDGKLDGADAKLGAIDIKVDALDDKVDTLDVKTDRIHTDLRDRMDHLTRAVAGEIVQGRYASASMDERFEAIERRLAELEKAK